VSEPPLDSWSWDAGDDTPLTDASRTELPDARPPVPELEAGGVVAGRFEIRERLGAGSAGVVYRAWDRDLGRQVALKIMDAGGPTRAARIQREGELTARLDHPAVVRIHSSGHAGGSSCYLAYELVEGNRTLGTELGDGLALPEAGPPRHLLGAVLTMVQGLAHAHAQGVVHRDLKPHNVLVDPEGRAKVADLGLATALGLDRLTQTGAVLGTPAYMAPEQLSVRGRGEQRAPQVDVWAAGVILYQTLTGLHPFMPVRNLPELMIRVNRGRPIPPRKHDPAIGAALQAVCLRCLEKDPQLRYPDARPLAEDLASALSGRPLSATGRQRRPWVVRGVDSRLLGVCALALLALGALLAALLDGPPGPNQPLGQPATQEPGPAGPGFEPGETRRTATRAAYGRRLLLAGEVPTADAVTASLPDDHPLRRCLAAAATADTTLVRDLDPVLRAAVARWLVREGAWQLAMHQRETDPTRLVRLRLGPASSPPPRALPAHVRPQSAHKALLAALALVPDSSPDALEARVLLARLTAPGSSERDERLAALETRAPDDARVRLLRAETHHARGEPGLVLAALSGLERETSVGAAWLRGCALLELARADEALPWLLEGLGDALDPDACRVVARALDDLDRAGAADPWRERARRLEGSHRRPAAERLQDLRARRRIQEVGAQEAFEQVLELDPLNHATDYSVGRAQMYVGDLAAGLAHSLRAIDRAGFLIHDLHRSLFQVTRRESSQLLQGPPLIDLVDRPFPPTPHGRLARALIMVLAMEFDGHDELAGAAISELDQVLAHDPATGVAWLLRSLAHLRLGRRAQAGHDLARARDALPGVGLVDLYQALLLAHDQAAPDDVRAALDRAMEGGLRTPWEVEWSLGIYVELRPYAGAVVFQGWPRPDDEGR
jgi:tetratricopeptide (TPR) repeat protein